MARFMRILLPALAALSLSACGVNSIPTKEEAAKAAWGEVQNQYQRRADLVPQIVGAVKGAAAQERNVLREVTEARASATQIQLSGEQLSDPAAMARFAEAQARLSTSILAVQRLQEAYPDLKTNANFMALQSQLEGTENRIAIARRDYNSAVQAFNTEIRTFPSIIGARIIYGSKPMTPYQAVSPGAETAPKVEF
ncbi:LemA family protein [Sandaracinobacteroides saxicola]|uniref:LemA family protein n=1 Tax=Sandaracinobacteroides saxicola TaxID=2759707 RepID=A0A7G5IGX5_9SPHN|nr:LemA family protein [Sandaracinobacteroides saxicola]QMW22617.1 LemA family protein [Sandaracinobacteroides saxicola]